MANYKIVNADQLDADLERVADAIRAKSGYADTLAFPEEFVQEISAISTGGAAPSLEPISVTENGIYIPGDGVDGFSSVTVNVAQGSSEDVRYVTFKNGDVELYKKPVAVGDNCVDVRAKGLIETPTKLGDNQYNYNFSGWADTDGASANASVLNNITENKTVYAAYSKISVIAHGDCGDATHWTLDTAGLLQIMGTGAVSDVEFNSQSNYFLGTNASKVKKLVVHEGVTHLGNHLFVNCDSLSQIIFPYGLVYIGIRCFQYCHGLTTVAIPDSVTSVGDYTFFGCNNLISVALSINQSVPRAMFMACKSLKKITIPAAATLVGRWSFHGCTALTSLVFEDPNGWYLEDINGTVTQNLDAATLADPASAATMAYSTYRDYYWKKI